MDETTTGVGDVGADPDPDRIKEDIDGIRRNLGGLVAELDRRRHDAFNMRLQMQRHPIPFAVGALVLTALAGMTVALLVRHRRQQHRLGFRLHQLPPRLHQLRLALARALAHPDRVANDKDPRLSRKLLVAGGTATATAVGKRLARRLVDARR